MEYYLVIIMQSLWILLPGGIANGTPPLAKNLWPKWNAPMDFGLELNGKRLFGEHKTFRGLFTGILMAIITSFLLAYLRKRYYLELPLIDYSVNTVWLGLASGCGALFGDAIKSFFKRQVNIPAGKSWFPFDQLDWIVGIILVYKIFFGITFPTILVTLLIGIFLHLLVRFIGYLFGIVKEAI